MWLKNIEKSFAFIALIALLAVIAYISYITFQNVNQGRIKISLVKAFPENKTFLLEVRNVGNFSVSTQKAYLTLPTGEIIIGTVELIEIPPGETRDVLVDFSFYIAVQFVKGETYKLKLVCSHNAADEITFKL